MGLAFSLSAAEKNHHQKEYYSGTDVQCVSAFERPHCIMNDRLYSLGWRVILAVISYSSGLHDQAMGIDTVGGAGHQRIGHSSGPLRLIQIWCIYTIDHLRCLLCRRC